MYYPQVKKLLFATLVVIVSSVLCPLPVKAQNWQPGIADAGPHIVTYVGQETAFKGFAISPEGPIIKYEWDFDGDGIVDWKSKTSAETTHTYTRPGKYTAILKAWDFRGQPCPLSTIKVIVREGQGKPAFIPKQHLHRSNFNKLKEDKDTWKKKLNLSTEEENFLEFPASNTLSSSTATDPSIGTIVTSRPADGIKKCYVLMLNGAQEQRFWDDVTYTYNMFTGQGVSPANIYLLNYDGKAPDGTNPGNIINYAATKSNLQLACNQIAAISDADDLVYVWVTGHGYGYNGPIQREESQKLVIGYLSSNASVDPGDEQDYLESDFKLRTFFTGGDYHPGHHGMETWKVYHYQSGSVTHYYRHKYVSHFSNLYFENMGKTVSDSDIYIEEIIDYLRGDFNKDGIIDPAAGERADYNNNGVPPYDPVTDTFDQDDWGNLDTFVDNINHIETIVPRPNGAVNPYMPIDINLDNHLSLDLDHDPLHPKANGTDIDNDGLIDGLDVNNNNNQNDIVSIDESLYFYGETVSDDELKAYLAPISAQAMVITLQPCYSGGFIEDLRAPNRIIMADCEEETVSFGNRFIRNLTSALSGLTYPDSQGDPETADANHDGKVDMMEMFNFAALNDYGTNLEIPQYEDNGDGISHAYPMPAGGDGTFGQSLTLKTWTSDTNPPSVQVIVPKINSLISGAIQIQVQASDDRAVTRVELYIDGNLWGSLASAPYQWGFNSGAKPDGLHSISAIAYDAAGNYGSSAPVSIIIDNKAPSGTITAPLSGSTVNGVVTISVSASDINGIKSVKFYVDGNPLNTDSIAPYQFNWNSALVTNGSHVLGALVTDAAGNSTAVPVVTIATNNDNIAPIVSITSPTSGTKVSGTITISATASDNTGVTKVEFYRDANILLGTATGLPYTISWNSRSIANGSHTLFAKAYDAAGNIDTATCLVTVSNIPVTGVTLSPTTATVYVGAVTQLTATVNPANASDKSVSWGSSNTAIATVSANGLVTAVTTGNATITVTTTDGSKTATCLVTVSVGSTSVYLEAECGTIGSLFSVQSGPTASNSAYATVKSGYNAISSPPSNASGWITFPFTLSAAGTYSVWFRTVCPDANGDSFWLKMDNGSFVRWNGILVSKAWTWGKYGVTFNLSAGSHTFTLGYSEDGAKLDKLLITTSSTNPSGTGSTAANLCTPVLKSAVTETEMDLVDILVFPNPVSDKLYVDLLNGSSTISIYSMESQQLLYLNIEDPKIVIDMTNYPSGIYIVKIVSCGQTITKKIIKQ